MADLTVPKQGDAWLNKDTKNLKYHLDNINYTLIPQGWFISGEIIEKPGYIVSISDVEWKPLNPGKIYKTDSEHVFKAIGIALNACNAEEPIEIQRDGLYHYDEINWPVAPFNTSDIGKTAYVSVSPDGQITTDITLATIGNNNVITVGQIISERDIDLSFSGDGRGPTDYSEIEYTTGEEIDASSTPILVSLKDDGFVYKSNKQSALNRYNVVGFIVGSELGLTILPIGTKVIVRRLGLLNGFSGLTPGLPIYASGDNNLITYGTITQHPESISVYYDKVVAIGIANSSSQIVVSILPAYSKNDDNIIGGIIMCDSTKTEPDTGYLFMDGSVLDAVTNPEYQELYDVVGNTWGGTDNTNFVLKDMNSASPLEKYQIKYKNFYQLQPLYTPVYRVEYPSTISWEVYSNTDKIIDITSFGVISSEQLKEFDIKTYAKKGTEIVKLPDSISFNDGIGTTNYGYTLYYVDNTHVKLSIINDLAFFNSTDSIQILDSTWEIKIIVIKNERFNRYRDVNADYTLANILDWISLSTAILNIEGYTHFLNTLDSTDINNGSVVIDGGVGIAKNLNVGGKTITETLNTPSGTLALEADSIQMNEGAEISGLEIDFNTEKTSFNKETFFNDVATFNNGIHYITSKQEKYFPEEQNLNASESRLYSFTLNKERYILNETSGEIFWDTGYLLSNTRAFSAGAGTQNAALAFGGFYSDGIDDFYLFSTEKFNGSAWSATGSLNTARAYLVGCGTQNEALAFGGVEGVESSVNLTEKFNGSTWSVTGNLNTARYSLAGCGTQNMALAFGGTNTDLDTPISSTEEFNGSIWYSGGYLNSARQGLAGVGSQNEALAFGGSTNVDSPISITEKYNGSIWSCVNTLNTERLWLSGSGKQNEAIAVNGYEESMTMLSSAEKFNGSIWQEILGRSFSLVGAGSAGNEALFFGGLNTDGYYLGDTEYLINSIHKEYIPYETFKKNKSSIWSATGNLNTARYGLAGCGTQNEALSFGGYTTTYSAVTEKFNGTTWSVTGNLNIARYALAGCGTQNEALSFGGTTGAISAVTEKFNGASWSVTGNLNTARAYLAGCGTQNEALSFGDTTGANSAVTEKFNGATWSATGNLNTARAYLAGCGTQNEALSFGGYTDSVSAVTEKFNGTIWSVTGSLNTARRHLAGAGTQNEALSFGGFTDTYSAVTEKFNGTTWSATGNLNTAKNSLAGAGTQNEALSFGGYTGTILAVTEKFGIITNIIYIPIAKNTWYFSSSLNTARQALAGCGTQNEALSFGGYIGSSLTVTEKFNGTIWSATGSLNTARQGLAGCGTQNEALSFGGYTGSYSAVTEKFNGTTWSATGSLNTARQGLAGAGTQNEALSFGGYIGSYLAVTEKFNGTTWSATGSLNTARHYLAGAGTQNEALSFGGGTGTFSAVTEKFNGTTWSATGSLNTARSGLAGCGTQNEALSFGGYTGANSAVTEKFNGTTWSATGSLNTARQGLAGCGTQNEALSFGGSSSAVTEKFNGEFNFRVSQFDGENNIELSTQYDVNNTLTGYFNKDYNIKIDISPLYNNFEGWYINNGNLNTARSYLAGCGTQNEALSFGGYDTAYLAVTEKFNGTTWSATGSLNIARRYLAGCGTQNEALSFGGYDTAYLAVTEKFNGSTWSATGNLNTARSGLAGCGTQNEALSFGGYIGSSLAVTEKFNGSTWSATGSLNTARRNLAGCGTQNEALSFGGYTGSSSAVTEKFNGTTWSATGNLNTARQGLAGCGTQNEALSFGGYTTTYSAVTEKFNGTTWSATGNLNTARQGLAGCGTQNEALSFGGYTGLYSAVTEKFNGTTWSVTGNLNTAREALAGCGTQNEALSFGGDTGLYSAVTEKFGGKIYHKVTIK